MVCGEFIEDLRAVGRIVRGRAACNDDRGDVAAAVDEINRSKRPRRTQDKPSLENVSRYGYQVRNFNLRCRDDPVAAFNGVLKPTRLIVEVQVGAMKDLYDIHGLSFRCFLVCFIVLLPYDIARMRKGRFSGV
jgi:hypothetical protein